MPNFWTQIETQFPGATEREQFQESVRELIDDLVSGLINGTVAAVDAAEVADVESVRRYAARLVRFTPEARETSLQLKRFLLRNVYSSDVLEGERQESIAKLNLALRIPGIPSRGHAGRPRAG